MVLGPDQICPFLHLLKNIIDGKPIKIFNKGNHIRDFTYVDDIVSQYIN